MIRRLSSSITRKTSSAWSIIFPALFLLALTPSRSVAMTRVYKAVYEGETYYIVALHPIRIETTILGRTILPGKHSRRLINGERLSDGTVLEEDYSAMEFLTYEGTPLQSSPDFRSLSENLKLRLLKADYEQDVAHVLEDYFFESVEDWALKQYKERRRIQSEEQENAIRNELKFYSQGLGWIIILDGRKRILGTLAYAMRTMEATKFPEEARLGIEIPDDDLVKTDQYPVYRDEKIQNFPRPVYSGLTLALKRYIIDRDSPIDLFQVLLAFGERSGMSRGLVETEYPPIHRGRMIEASEFHHLVGKYVLESDAKAATVYQRAPYNFSLHWHQGDDYVLHATRAQFLSLLENDPKQRGKKGKVAGKAFLSMAQIMGGVVVSPNQVSDGYLRGSYEPKTMHQFKLDWLSPAARSCSSLFSKEILSFR